MIHTRLNRMHRLYYSWKELENDFLFSFVERSRQTTSGEGLKDQPSRGRSKQFKTVP